MHFRYTIILTKYTGWATRLDHVLCKFYDFLVILLDSDDSVSVCGSENGNFKVLAGVNDEEEEASFPGPFRRWPPCHSHSFTMRLLLLRL